MKKFEPPIHDNGEEQYIEVLDALIVIKPAGKQTGARISLVLPAEWAQEIIRNHLELGKNSKHIYYLARIKSEMVNDASNQG